MHSRCIGQHLTKTLPLSWSAEEEGGGEPDFIAWGEGGREGCREGGRTRGREGGGGFEEVGVAHKGHKPVRYIECSYLEREVKY